MYNLDQMDVWILNLKVVPEGLQRIFTGIFLSSYPKRNLRCIKGNVRFLGNTKFEQLMNCYFKLRESNLR